MKISTALLTVALTGILTGCNSIKPTTVSASSGNTSPESHAPVAPAMNSTVNIVRNGFLGGHDTTTIGKAFGGTFQDVQWKSFETPKGVTIVEFTGTTTATGVPDRSPEAQHACIESLGIGDTLTQLLQRQKAPQMTVAEDNEIMAALAPLNVQILDCEDKRPTPVKFQFAISADKTSFELTFVDPRPWKTSAFMEATGVHYEDRGSFSRYVTDQGVSTEKILAFIYR